jgi:predicted nucleic acid-binding protein
MGMRGLVERLVVDASIGIKWIIQEEDSADARLCQYVQKLLVPPLFWIETANALTTKVRSAMLTAEAALLARRDLCLAPVVTVETTQDMIDQAMTLASAMAHPIYDSVYLALAVSEKCSLLTADARFLRAAKACPPAAAHILSLADFAHAHR